MYLLCKCSVLGSHHKINDSLFKHTGIILLQNTPTLNVFKPLPATCKHIYFNLQFSNVFKYHILKQSQGEMQTLHIKYETNVHMSSKSIRGRVCNNTQKATLC